MRLRMLLAFAVGCVVVGCGPEEERLNILDAAEIYRGNPEAFKRIREHFLGPISETRRIPALDDADNRPEDIEFLKALRQAIPVELIQLSPGEADESERIEVVLGAYGLAVSGRTVSVVFFENFVKEDVANPRVAVFDQCDNRALDWLYADHGSGDVHVFCRLNDHWYAYQDLT